jgi:heparan-alpha-glucosaminide N-acetyltransferase
MSSSQPDTFGPGERASARLVSLDAYRGAVMLLMASEGLKLTKVAEDFPDSRVWHFLAAQSDHVRWQGCHLWDLIMPAFLLMVGVAIPFSIASRRRRGQTFKLMFAHALWRSFVLVVLGIFIMSQWAGHTDYNFINVLSQIGLGYWIVFILAELPFTAQAAAFVAILVGWWYLFFQHPLPALSFNYASVGVPPNWHHPEGVAAHWDLNTNPVAAFDRWFLNLFPRSAPFHFRPGGGGTLNFVPAIATMLLGVMAGNSLRSERQTGRGLARFAESSEQNVPVPFYAATPQQKVRGLAIAGILSMIAGIALDPAILPGVESMRWSLCPIIKTLWTPSYVLYSGGWVMLGLALFHWIIDGRGWRAWTFPLIVVGTNSIVMYLLAALLDGWTRRTLRMHLGSAAFDGPYGPILESAAVLAIFWLVCLWLYRKRVFVRI